MIRSMTAFATQQGYADAKGGGANWTWEVRSVNGRGLDVKVRMPDSTGPQEAAVRGFIAKVCARGNITVGLRVQRDQADSGALQINPTNLDAALEALDTVRKRAFDRGVTVGPPTVADVLAQRGVLVTAQNTAIDLTEDMAVGFQNALDEMIAMREAEGHALFDVLMDQLDQIEAFTEQAAVAAQARTQTVKTQMAEALARVMDNTTGIDPDRMTQELALLAVKSDITEEIDRLGAHVIAARDLLETGGPVGRKLDFLTQEFNREANTLCSKAQDVALTQIGLALKAVIDQMREQVQNVE